MTSPSVLLLALDGGLQVTGGGGGVSSSEKGKDFNINYLLTTQMFTKYLNPCRVWYLTHLMA